jgi:hypothetical protein
MRFSFLVPGADLKLGAGDGPSDCGALQNETPRQHISGFCSIAIGAEFYNASFPAGDVARRPGRNARKEGES